MASGGGTAGALSVALVGFMGSGKTAVGTRLATSLGVPFIDTDQWIAAREGPIAEIFARRGEAEFRRLEHEAVVGAVERALREPVVLSPGGGAVTDAAARASLRTLPHVVWLTAPVAVLWERVSRSSGTRPLAADRATFERLLEVRAPLYEEVATESVANDGARPVDDVVAQIAGIVGVAATDGHGGRR